MSREEAAPHGGSRKDGGHVSVHLLPPPCPLGGFLFPSFLPSQSPHTVCMPGSSLRQRSSTSADFFRNRLNCPSALPPGRRLQSSPSCHGLATAHLGLCGYSYVNFGRPSSFRLQSLRWQRLRQVLVLLPKFSILHRMQRPATGDRDVNGWRENIP